MEAACERDRIHKARAKQYADKTRRAKPCDIQEGDTVLLRQQKKNKLSTTYDPRPYIVRQKKGPSPILQRANEPSIMRNASFVRKIPYDCAPQPVPDENDTDDEDIVLPAVPGRVPLLVQAPHARPGRQRRAPAHLRDFILT